jgi:hypothetical protein
MAPPVTWSVRALGWARWWLLRGRGRVCLPRPRSSPSPWVGRGGDRRLRPGLSPSPGVGRGGVRRLPGLSPRPSPGVRRGGVRRLLGLSPSPSPGVGRGGVRRLPGPSPSLSPGSGEAEFVVFRGRARVRALGRAKRSSSSSGAEPKSEPWVGRCGVSYGARGRTWLLSASLYRVAQQSEWRRRRCPLVRPISGAAKWLRSLRLCRLKGARQDKVSGHLCIKCFCETVGQRGDLAKVDPWRRLGLGRTEGVSFAGGGPRARRKSSGVGSPCPRLGSGEARSCPFSGPSLDLIAPIRPLQLCADGGYQLRLGVLGVPLIMVPDNKVYK